MLRWLLRILTALVLLTAVGVAIGWWLLAGGRAQLDGTRPARLSAPVTITRDALGTVTISARNRRDIGYALGYVQAQERFFEMDLMRRLPAGELSALVGRRRSRSI